MAAFGRIADIPQRVSEGKVLNVCFHLKRTLKPVKFSEPDRLLSAKSGLKTGLALFSLYRWHD
jgi:hypothetical protein